MLFKTNWSNLVRTGHVCNFSLPFFHLRGEKFWHLVPKSGFEGFLLNRESISSLSELNGSVQYAFLDDNLFELMCDPKTNKFLHQLILDEYFPSAKKNYSYSSSLQQKLFEEIEAKILNEDASEYRAEIIKLLEQKNEEEIFLRGSLFKREIPKIYNYTCCISGMRITSSASVSMIDACHIVPFSQSYNDTVSNGIALCPNLHRAFDRGLIGIDDDYKVIVNSNWNEEQSSYLIKHFENKKILLPSDKTCYPNLENFSSHRKKFDF